MRAHEQLNTSHHTLEKHASQSVRESFSTSSLGLQWPEQSYACMHLALSTVSFPLKPDQSCTHGQASRQATQTSCAPIPVQLGTLLLPLCDLPPIHPYGSTFCQMQQHSLHPRTA